MVGILHLDCIKILCIPFLSTFYITIADGEIVYDHIIGRIEDETAPGYGRVGTCTHDGFIGGERYFPAEGEMMIIPYTKMM